MKVERRELAVGIVGEVAGSLIQLDAADVRRVDRLVADFQQLVVKEILQLSADDSALGQPEDQPGADHRIDGEELKLLAQHAVVAALGLVDLLEVLLHVLLLEPGRAVEPLQLLPVGVAFPIGPGDAEQFERADRAGGRDVRPSAEIYEFALPIERYAAVIGKAGLNVLDLECLPQIAAQLHSLAAVHLRSLEGLVFLDDLCHFRLDRGKVVLGKRRLGLKIVVEAVLDGRPEGKLDAVVESHHGPGHDVRRRVPHDV